jgi:O-antigen/teichoic acid export membrane protein
MGVTDYGIYIYAYTWAKMLVLVGRMGADKGLIRFMPEYRSHEQWGRFRGALRFGIRTVLISCTGLALIGASVVWLLYDTMPASQPETLYWALAMLPILGLIQLWKGALQAFKRIAQALSPELLVKHLMVGGGSLVLYTIMGGTLTAPYAMGATFVAVLVTFGAGGVFLWRALPDEMWKVESRETPKYWLRAMWPMMVMAGASITMKRTDLIMVGAFLGPDETGVYGAVVRISELARFGLQAINSIAAPLIAELYHSGKHGELQQLTTWSFAGVVGFVMMMTGHQYQSMQILVIAAVLNIILNAILIPFFGIIGGAIATSSTMAAWNMWMVLYTYKEIGIRSLAI